MTVSSTTLPIIHYQGNDSTTVFSTVFVFKDSTDLVVTLTLTSGVDVVKTINTDYTVSGGSGSTGNVTMLTAPTTGQHLTIQRVTSKTQPLDYVENDAFPAASHEAALDKLTLITQELYNDHTRVLSVDPSADISDLSIPILASGYLRWNSDGTALETATIVSSGTVTFPSQGMLVYAGSTALSARTLTGTANKITVTNGSGVSGDPTITLASTLDLTGHTVKLKDSTLTIEDDSDSTKKLAFQLSGITTATTRTLTVPNASGTIALTSDITSGAPTDASYLTLGTNGTLTSERVLTAGSNVSFVDTGAGGTLTISSANPGVILQVVQGTLTSTTSTSSSTFSSTGLTASITPSSSSNKILVTVSTCGGSNPTGAGLIIKRNGTTDLIKGDVTGSRISVHSVISTYLAYQLNGTTIQYLDSPATTSSTSYTLYFNSLDNSTAVGINRSVTDTNSAAYARGASTITLQEIKV